MTKPYWTDGQVSLYLGDCREVLGKEERSDEKAGRPPERETASRVRGLGSPWPFPAVGVPHPAATDRTGCKRGGRNA